LKSTANKYNLSTKAEARATALRMIPNCLLMGDFTEKTARTI
jgi:hypothetical protein